MARVAVLLGGMSAEREVSLVTGEAFAMAVDGHECIRIDAGADVASRLTATKPDVALIGLHGKFGERRAIQGLLELMGIPYTGSSECRGPWTRSCPFSLRAHGVSRRRRSSCTAARKRSPRRRVVTPAS